MSRLRRDFWARPFAHRGLHDQSAGRVENSPGAIRAAMAAGYGIELDVQLSADGEAMVFHDPTLERLTGAEGRVDARTADALREIALAGSDETIPTLPEALDAVDGAVPVLVEIKSQTEGQGVGPLEARVAECLSAYRGPVAAMGFNPFSMIWLCHHAPEILRGLVSYDYADVTEMAPKTRRDLAGLAHLEACAADFVSYGARSLPTPETERLRAAGMPVFCWTIRSPDAARSALRHSDQITFEGFLP